MKIKSSSLKAADLIVVLFKCADDSGELVSDFVYDSSLSDEEVAKWFSSINDLEIDTILR